MKPLKTISILLVVGLLALSGCAAGRSTKRLEFTAPAQSDPALLPFLDDVSRLGVMCVTDIEPFRELDIEKVMARLSNAIGHKLSTLPDITIVSQDEITWQVKGVEFDSTAVITQATREALIDTLQLDALVVVELEHLQARTTPMTPTPYGLTSDPGLDLAIDLRVSLLNLHSGRIWQQTGQQRDWQPIRLQLFGGNQGERQLLMALSGPLERFLIRLAPPPHPQIRYFDLSGS